MSEREDREFARRIAEPLREPERAQPGFEARVAAAVRAASDRGEAPGVRQARGSFAWLVSPRRLAVSPLGGLALAAGFAALVAATTLAVGGDGGIGESATVAARNRQVVQFAIVAPNANTVTLVGDFNAWDTKTTPMTKGAERTLDGDGSARDWQLSIRFRRRWGYLGGRPRRVDCARGRVWHA